MSLVHNMSRVERHWGAKKTLGFRNEGSMNIFSGSEGIISRDSQWITKQGWECSASHESWPANWGGGPLWHRQRTTWGPKKNKTKCKIANLKDRRQRWIQILDSFEHFLTGANWFYAHWPWGGEQGAVDSPEGGESHRDGHDPRHDAQQLLAERLRGEKEHKEWMRVREDVAATLS